MQSHESELKNPLLRKPLGSARTYSASHESPPQFPPYVPGVRPEPERVVKFLRFLLVMLVLLILMGVTVGIAAFYANQLQDYNRLQSQFRDLASQNFALQNEVQRLKIQTSNPTLVLGTAVTNHVQWPQVTGEAEESPTHSTTTSRIPARFQ